MTNDPTLPAAAAAVAVTTPPAAPMFENPQMAMTAQFAQTMLANCQTAEQAQQCFVFLREQMDALRAEQAKADFDDAFADACSEMPDWKCDRQGHFNTYLTLGHILGKAKPILAKHKITLTFSTTTGADEHGRHVTTAVVLSGHGHQQFNTMQLPLQIQSASKLDPGQQVGKIRSYCARYAVYDALGIAADGDDLDSTDNGQQQQQQQDQQQQQQRGQAAAGKHEIAFNPPFSKDGSGNARAKELGARWDGNARVWRLRGENLRELFELVKDLNPKLTPPQERELGLTPPPAPPKKAAPPQRDGAFSDMDDSDLPGDEAPPAPQQQAAPPPAREPGCDDDEPSATAPAPAAPPPDDIVRMNLSASVQAKLTKAQTEALNTLYAVVAEPWRNANAIEQLTPAIVKAALTEACKMDGLKATIASFAQVQPHRVKLASIQQLARFKEQQQRKH